MCLMPSRGSPSFSAEKPIEYHDGSFEERDERRLDVASQGALLAVVVEQAS